MKKKLEKIIDKTEKKVAELEVDNGPIKADVIKTLKALAYEEIKNSIASE